MTDYAFLTLNLKFDESIINEEIEKKIDNYLNDVNNVSSTIN